MKEEEQLEGDLLSLLARAEEELAAEDAARVDPRWERLLAGSLDAEQVAALASEARTSEEARRNFETFQPLGGDFQDAVVEALQTQPGGGAAVPSEAAPPQSARVLPFQNRRRWIGGLASAAAALAALLVLVLGRPDGLPPLPEYQLELLGGTQEMRSGEGPEGSVAKKYVEGNRFELLLRPQAKVEGEVAVRSFLARGEDLRPFEVPAEISDQGAVRLQGEIGRDVQIEAGAWTLWLTVGRPGTLPTIEEFRAHLAAPAPAPGPAPGGWALYRTSFEVGEPEEMGGEPP